MKKLDSRLADIYNADDDKLAQYQRWAADYDSDLVDDLGYVAHLRGAEIFAEVAPDRKVRVLDMGCGTGLVGETLAGMGYGRLDGADFSSEMLAVAARRGVYRALHRYDITRPPAFEGQYDALISVGVFSYGAPHISNLPNAVRCVRPGCPCVITVNAGAWDELNLADALDTEAGRHRFTVEEIRRSEYIRKEGITARVLIIRR